MMWYIVTFVAGFIVGAAVLAYVLRYLLTLDEEQTLQGNFTRTEQRGGDSDG